MAADESVARPPSALRPRPLPLPRASSNCPTTALNRLNLPCHRVAQEIDGRESREIHCTFTFSLCLFLFLLIWLDHHHHHSIPLSYRLLCSFRSLHCKNHISQRFHSGFMARTILAGMVSSELSPRWDFIVDFEFHVVVCVRSWRWTSQLMHEISPIHFKTQFVFPKFLSHTWKHFSLFFSSIKMFVSCWAKDDFGSYDNGVVLSCDGLNGWSFASILYSKLFFSLMW